MDWAEDTGDTLVIQPESRKDNTTDDAPNEVTYHRILPTSQIRRRRNSWNAGEEVRDDT